MHTSQGGRKADTDGSVGSYGWKNAVKIGQKFNGHNNADSLAFFALGKLLGSCNVEQRADHL